MLENAQMNDKQFYEQDALRKIPESTRRIEELRYRMLISKVPKGSKKVLDISAEMENLYVCLLKGGINVWRWIFLRTGLVNSKLEQENST